jgi:hypothetical protein
MNPQQKHPSLLLREVVIEEQEAWTVLIRVYGRSAIQS